MKTIKFNTNIMKLTINFNNLIDGLWDIEKQVSNLIKHDLKASKVTAKCVNRNWYESHLISFKIIADGLKFDAHIECSLYDVKNDIEKLEYTLTHTF